MTKPDIETDTITNVKNIKHMMSHLFALGSYLAGLSLQQQQQ